MGDWDVVGCTLVIWGRWCVCENEAAFGVCGRRNGLVSRHTILFPFLLPAESCLNRLCRWVGICSSGRVLLIRLGRTKPLALVIACAIIQ